MTPERDELNAALEKLGHRYPHWRFGQLLANVAGWVGVELWDADEEQLLTAIHEHLATSPKPVGSIRS